MAKRTPTIVNPNQVFTKEEETFINENRSETLVESSNPTTKTKRRARARNFSMFDDFYEDLVKFLEEFPNEGNKSSFIVRVVGDYIEKKRLERQRNQLPTPNSNG